MKLSVEMMLEGGRSNPTMQVPSRSAYTWAMTDVQPQLSAEAPARRSGAARQQPISAYGLIGDMRTAALVGLDGSIDWCCLPRFDSGSVFASLLDTERGGTWSMRPEGKWTSTQRYLPRTNILETTFRTADDAVVSVTDFMPVAEDGRPSGPHPEIHRRLRCSRGRALMSMIFMPRFEYGARTTRLELLRAGLFATDRTDQVLTLSSAKPFEWVIEQSTATARFELEKGEERWLVLRYDDDDIHPVDRYESARKLDNTAAFWQQWSSKVRYRGPYRGMVKRSALTLKLLTHAETGAMIAAPDHVAARDDRRRAQLGLSLRVAQGCRVHPRRARCRGPLSRGRPVHALSQEGLPPRGRRSPADHVRHRRAPGPHRAPARPSERVSTAHGRCGWATVRSASSSSTSTAR